MAKTEVRGGQIKDTSVQRDDLDTATAGQAVLRRVIAGTNITIGSTGADTGTGDVTINASLVKPFYAIVGSANADYITDGIDDHVQIQQAIDAANAAGGGEVVVRGTANLGNTSSGYILLKSGVTLRGEGIGKTIIVGGTVEYSNNSTSVGCITTAATSGAAASTSKTTHLNMVVRDMTIKPHNGGYGITAYNFTGMRVENVETFTPTASPTLIKAGFQFRFGANLWVNRNYVHDTHGNGINVNGVDYFDVRGNIVKNTYDDAIDIDFDFGDTNSVKSRYGDVAGNSVNGITEGGNCIRVENCDYVTVTNNYVSAGSPTNAGVGIWVGNYNVAGVTCTNITVSHNHVYNCKTIGIQTESEGNATGATVSNILITNNTVVDCGANSGTDLRGGIVHGAQVSTGTRVRIVGNTVDGVARTGGDAGGIVIYKKGQVDVLNNFVRNATNGILIWNGSAAETYSSVYVDNNTNTATTAYPNQNNALTQAGVIIRKASTQTETYEVSKVDGATTTQGYFRGFNPQYPNAWAGMEIKTAAGGDQTDLLFYTGFGTAGEKMRLKTNTGALLVGTPTDDGTNKVQVAGGIVSTATGIGYATGAGGTVTQATSKSTGVTLNKLCGTITMNGAALASQATVSFTLTNSAIAATDVVIVNHNSVGTMGAYNFGITPAAGSVTIAVRNIHTASLSEAIVLRFAVIKAVTS